ncbi:vesicle transport protein SEC22 [Vigna unguiculata]|uniref:Vesicle transport protein SEC22 n=1 Tax=Vigna unguiculata TaxID=3917 RepID=A0A4D6N5T4_VIGUN|nr:vesicle transport protein SEC22 [Vigna unguiculata]
MFPLCEIFVFAKQITISLSDGIIANISRQYIDTRTQANLSKLNANRKQYLDVASEDFYNIVERKRNSVRTTSYNDRNNEKVTSYSST